MLINLSIHKEKQMDYEKALISCFIIDYGKSTELIEKKGLNIVSAMFEHKLTKCLYETISEMIKDGVKLEISIINKLCHKKTGTYNLSEIMDISNEVSTCANADFYAEKIYFKHSNKKNMELLRQAAEKIKADNTLNSDTIFQELIDSYNKSEKRINNRFECSNFEQLYVKFAERLLSTGGKTGYDRLDQFVNFQFGYVFTVAGRSGVGKTTYGFQLLKSVCDIDKCHGLMVSMEMPGASLYERTIGTYIGFTTKTGYSKDGLKAKINADVCEMVNKHYENIFVNDQDGLTIEEIEQIIKTARRKTHNLNVVCIDYLGYLKSDINGSNYDKVSANARAIKGLAKRLGIKIILLVQTSRDGEDGTVPVKLHHLRDSGAIEESADIVVGLWGDKDQANRLHGEILKNRDGEKGGKFDCLRYNTYLEECDYTEQKSALDNVFDVKKWSK